MVTDYAGRRVLPLSDKETAQLVSYSERCQPYYAFDEVVFCKLIDLVLPEIRCKLYIGNNAVYRYLKEKLNLFVGKYYPNGFKENTQSDYLFFRNELVKKVQCPRIHCSFKDYNRVEKDLFIMLMRSCRDYIYANFTEEAEDKFIKSLYKISLMAS